MNEKEISDSIKLLNKQLRSGKSIDDCVRLLAGAGYKEEDISVVVEKLNANKRPIRKASVPKSPPSTLSNQNKTSSGGSNTLLIVGGIIVVLVIIASLIFAFVIPVTIDNLEEQKVDTSKATLEEIHLVMEELFNTIINDSRKSVSETRQSYEDLLKEKESVTDEEDLDELNRRLMIVEFLLAGEVVYDDVLWLQNKEQIAYEKGKNATTGLEIDHATVEVLNTLNISSVVILIDVIAITQVLQDATDVEDEEVFLGYEHEVFNNSIEKGNSVLGKDSSTKVVCELTYSDMSNKIKEYPGSGMDKFVSGIWLSAYEVSFFDNCNSVIAEYIDYRKKAFRTSLSGDDEAKKIVNANVLIAIDEFFGANPEDYPKVSDGIIKN